MYGRPVEDGAPADPSAVDREVLADRRADRSMMRGPAQAGLVRQVDDTIGGATDPRGGLRDRLQHGRQVGRRAADETQHVARRLLALDGLPQLGVARAERLGEPRVFGGEGRLVREGSE